ncbi:MAG: ATP-binding cassette domain-containing protein, partial [Firmicutes bacterium]|nr:ATP-binding cassette domain-containing protein [Bacillota bacterium]
VQAVRDFSLDLCKGEIVCLEGDNGCGKTSVLRAIRDLQPHQGVIHKARGLKVSCIQQVEHLDTNLADYAKQRGLDVDLFLVLLAKLGFERKDFENAGTKFASGQKKKVALAASLCTPANLYLWDEPLNFLDIFARMQIKNLLLEYRPTMLLVDHDAVFVESVATRIVRL